MEMLEFNHKSVARGDPFSGSVGEDEPLFWAIRCNNTKAVAYLL
jgi:hypothetical protein